MGDLILDEPYRPTYFDMHPLPKRPYHRHTTKETTPMETSTVPSGMATRDADDLAGLPWKTLNADERRKVLARKRSILHDLDIIAQGKKLLKEKPDLTATEAFARIISDPSTQVNHAENTNRRSVTFLTDWPKDIIETGSAHSWKPVADELHLHPGVPAIIAKGRRKSIVAKRAKLRNGDSKYFTPVGRFRFEVAPDHAQPGQWLLIAAYIPQGDTL